MFSRRFFVCLVFLCAAIPAHAQLQVGLRLSRRLYLSYEPIIATVTVTNLSGHDVMLDEVDGAKWFAFEIETGDHVLVPPRNPDYQLAPLMLPNGQTMKRSVNLVSLYPVNDFGLYRVRASIYFPDLHRYFSSQQLSVEISEGKLMWQQTVGVPAGHEGAGSYRVYSLLSFRQIKDNVLYVRVEDKDASVIYATYPLGRILVSNEPQIQLDTDNQLHVLELVGPKTYTYTRIGLNGEWLGQTTYTDSKVRPKLKKLASGQVDVVGGQVEVPPDKNAPAGPKLSDRPAGMPTE